MSNNSTIVHAPTNNLGQSEAFYRQLGFSAISAQGANVFTDGKACIEISPDRFARAGVKIFDRSNVNLPRLKEIATVAEQQDGGLVTCDPNGIFVYLPAEPCDWDFDSESTPASMLGNFVGLSIEAHNAETTAKFWEALGYKIAAGDIAKGWAKLSNNSAIDISIMKSMMCPHLFFNPGMTYFNGEKNLDVIASLRNAGIPITEEISHFNEQGIVDNVIIRDPSGLGFFVFND